MVDVELPYPPSLNRLYRVVRGRPILSAEGRAYKARVEAICAALRLQPAEGPVSVRVVFYRPARRGDLDNGLKCLLDSVQGHLYRNDSQLVGLMALRREDAERPRVELRVEELATEASCWPAFGVYERPPETTKAPPKRGQRQAPRPVPAYVPPR